MIKSANIPQKIESRKYKEATRCGKTLSYQNSAAIKSMQYIYHDLKFLFIWGKEIA
ncbi:MAG: hypothetical protein ACMUEK_01700 [Sodalis sp. (in: enterobacteria)]